MDLCIDAMYLPSAVYFSWNGCILWDVTIMYKLEGGKELEGGFD